MRGDAYEIVAVPGKDGSVPAPTPVADGTDGMQRVPGVLVKEVLDGRVVATPAATRGTLRELLRPARAIVPDPRAEQCRSENPSRL